MMLLQPPPLPPAPAERVLRADSAMALAAFDDTPLMLTKEGRSERAFARRQIYVKTETRMVEAPTNGSAPAAILDADCRWKLTAQMQRQLCFVSMTGQFSCTESVMYELKTVNAGSQAVPLDKLEEGCGLTWPAVRDAQRVMSAAIAQTQKAEFDTDLTQTILPQLIRTGVAARVLPPTGKQP